MYFCRKNSFSWELRDIQMWSSGVNLVMINLLASSRPVHILWMVAEIPKKVKKWKQVIMVILSHLGTNWPPQFWVREGTCLQKILPVINAIKGIKADRPHLHNYPHMPTDYRQKDEQKSYGSAGRAWTNGQTDGRMDATKSIIFPLQSQYKARQIPSTVAKKLNSTEHFVNLNTRKRHSVNWRRLHF